MITIGNICAKLQKTDEKPALSANFRRKKKMYKEYVLFSQSKHL